MVIVMLSPQIIIFCGYTFGVYHAFKKHNPIAGGVSLVFILPAYYYSTEMLFWHKEPEVDYNEVIKMDLQTFVGLCNEAMFMKHPPESIKDIKNFKKKFKNYPSEIQTKLKTQSRMYVEYFILLSDDAIAQSKRTDLGEIKEYPIPPKLVELESELRKLGLERLFDSFHKQFDLMKEQLSTDTKENTHTNDVDAEEFKNFVNGMFGGIKVSVKSFYEEMYNEKF